MKLTNPPFSVLSHSDATNTISRIDSAVNHLNNERARMGAYQNQLEYIMHNLGNTEENLQASESLIRDADISQEILPYTQNNVLSQANQLMIAQANQRHEASLKGILLNSQA